MFHTMFNRKHPLSFFTVVEHTQNLAFRTCMGWGPNYYRTFDGMEFLFPGRCSYTLFSDGIRSVVISLDGCSAYLNCKKVPQSPLPVHYQYYQENARSMVNGQDTMISSSQRIKMKISSQEI